MRVYLRGPTLVMQGQRFSNELRVHLNGLGFLTFSQRPLAVGQSHPHVLLVTVLLNRQQLSLAEIVQKYHTVIVDGVVMAKGNWPLGQICQIEDKNCPVLRDEDNNMAVIRHG